MNVALNYTETPLKLNSINMHFSVKVVSLGGSPHLQINMKILEMYSHLVFFTHRLHLSMML